MLKAGAKKINEVGKKSVYIEYTTGGCCQCVQWQKKLIV